jgi:hypothetical protein
LHILSHVAIRMGCLLPSPAHYLDKEAAGRPRCRSADRRSILLRAQGALSLGLRNSTREAANVWSQTGYPDAYVARHAGTSERTTGLRGGQRRPGSQWHVLVLLLDRKWPVAKIQVYESPGIRTGDPRGLRPRCGAKNSQKIWVWRQALANGRCADHGGLSTGTKPRLDASAFPSAQKQRWNACRETKKRRPEGDDIGWYSLWRKNLGEPAHLS